MSPNLWIVTAHKHTIFQVGNNGEKKDKTNNLSRLANYLFMRNKERNSIKIYYINVKQY
jgi:hypothetical protein